MNVRVWCQLVHDQNSLLRLLQVDNSSRKWQPQCFKCCSLLLSLLPTVTLSDLPHRHAVRLLLCQGAFAAIISKMLGLRKE